MWYWKENTEVPPENLRKKKKRKKNDQDIVVIWMEEGVQLWAPRMESAVPPP